MIPILYMYSKRDYDRLMHGHDDLKDDDEEPKKKKLSLKQIFDGEPKIIKKKKKEKAKTEKTKLIQK